MKTYALNFARLAILLLIGASTGNADDAISKQVLKLFPQADTNKDGVISDAEEANQVSVKLDEADVWQRVTTTIPGDHTIIHVRVQVPGGVTAIKSLQLKPARGKSVTLIE